MSVRRAHGRGLVRRAGPRRRRPPSRSPSRSVPGEGRRPSGCRTGSRPTGGSATSWTCSPRTCSPNRRPRRDVAGGRRAPRLARPTPVHRGRRGRPRHGRGDPPHPHERGLRRASRPRRTHRSRAGSFGGARRRAAGHRPSRHRRLGGAPPGADVSDAYVVMVTVHADEFDRVLGLSSGADDYITKPFAPRELVAASGRCSVARGGAVERARRRRRTPP